MQLAPYVGPKSIRAPTSHAVVREAAPATVVQRSLQQHTSPAHVIQQRQETLVEQQEIVQEFVDVPVITEELRYLDVPDIREVEKLEEVPQVVQVPYEQLVEEIVKVPRSGRVVRKRADVVGEDHQGGARAPAGRAGPRKRTEDVVSAAISRLLGGRKG